MAERVSYSLLTTATSSLLRGTYSPVLGPKKLKVELRYDSEPQNLDALSVTQER